MNDFEEDAQTPLLGAGVIAYQLRDQHHHLTALEKRIQELEANIRRRDEVRAQNEKRYLWTGIIFLGTIISTLGTIIWSYRAIIFQGKQ